MQGGVSELRELDEREGQQEQEMDERERERKVLDVGGVKNERTRGSLIQRKSWMPKQHTGESIGS